MRSIFNLLLCCFFLYVGSNAQTKTENYFNEMKTAFLLGLDTKGLDICHDILTKSEYSDAKPKTLSFIADYFLYKGISDTTASDKITKAYYFYNELIKNFPSTEYSQKAKEMLSKIKNLYADYLLSGETVYEYEVEREIVNKKLRNANILVHFNVKPAVYYLTQDIEADPILTVNKYLDDIIVNNPKFEIYGYQYKILLYLNLFSETNIISPSIIHFDRIMKYSTRFEEERKKFDKYLGIMDSLMNVLDQKYPTHTITLDLHFICSQVLMVQDEYKFKQACFKHLNFILKNDEDKLGLRYLLSKEIILNKRFD